LHSTPARIRLVVFDWAGTTVDHGCIAPTAAFVRTFADHGVEVPPAVARGPMGLHKKDHVRALFQYSEVAGRWRAVHGHDWSEADVERLYRHLIPVQLETLVENSRLVPELLDCVAELRQAGVRIGATTGYFRKAAEQVYAAAHRQSFAPDHCVCAEDVPAGRPAPWMMFRIMEALDVYPGAAVVKVGDTVPDVDEALAAGAWSVGVTRTGSEVGCTAEELARMTDMERKALLDGAREKLLAAGAHAVIETLAELPALLTTFADRLQRGEKP
jgi:phosphonoacetaldehyde hydrolase